MTTAKALLYWIVPLVLIWIVDLSGLANEINPYWFSVIMYAGINIIMATSLNLVNGFTGQFSMGHAGFMAVGAYVSAAFTTYLQSNYPNLVVSHMGFTSVEVGVLLGSYGIFALALVLGGLASALVGYVVGLPSLRLSGDYLAIVTLGFGEIIRVLLLNMNVVGGARGMPNIPSLASFGWVYSFTLFTVFVVWRILKTPHGRSFLSVREDEIAAQSMGVNTTATKVQAFVLASFLAGVGGGLFAHFLKFINPATFDLNRSFEMIIMVVMGGMGSVTGAVFAGGFLTVLREALRELQSFTGVDLRMIIYSLFLILLMLTRPMGIFGHYELRDIVHLLRKKKVSEEGMYE